MAPLSEELSKTTCDSQENFELESQFILRLPYIPAASLRVAIKSGSNLKLEFGFLFDRIFFIF